MAKIIDINDSVISIGTDDGSILEIETSEINFVPHINDEVEIFKTSNRTIVSKVEKKIGVGDGGININLTNTQSTASANTVSQVATQTTVGVAVNGKLVNKTVYCLLAFFLGNIGAHKFYAGKTGVGIIYLLFCWSFIPEIIAIFEGISALMKPADANGNIII